VIALILAGGQGQRMGGIDKGEIVLGDARMIDVVVAKIERQGLSFKISGSHDYGFGCEVIPDLDPGPKGPVAGIYAAYQALKGSSELGFFTVPIDGPNLPDNLFDRLYDKGRSAVACDDIGLHPAFGWWLLEDLKAAWNLLDISQSLSLKRLVEISHARHINWADNTLFANINTANDLANYLNSP